MSCEGCITSAKMLDMQKQAVLEQAKKFANENKTTVAVYHEMGTWKYLKAEIAAQEGIPATIYIQHNAT